MIKVEREQLINYIKDNIDICLASTDIELNLDTRSETLDGNILVFPQIEATIKIDYDSFVEYTRKPFSTSDEIGLEH
jgi:phage pi2 protein 07